MGQSPPAGDCPTACIYRSGEKGLLRVEDLELCPTIELITDGLLLGRREPSDEVLRQHAPRRQEGMSLCRPSGDDIGAGLPIALCSEALWCYPELRKIANDRFGSALGEAKVVARRPMAVGMGEEADRHLWIIR